MVLNAICQELSCVFPPLWRTNTSQLISSTALNAISIELSCFSIAAFSSNWKPDTLAINSRDVKLMNRKLIQPAVSHLSQTSEHWNSLYRGDENNEAFTTDAHAVKAAGYSLAVLPTNTSKIATHMSQRACFGYIRLSAPWRIQLQTIRCNTE